jgi:CubicO group peptidase (beta-lactamase class C family)
MKKLAKNLLTLSLCLTSTSILAQSPNAPSKTSHAERIDRIFSQYDKADSPGCATLVIREGKTIYERGYGFSNLEHSIPISVEQTRFEIGSTAKQFTATALLLLVQEGKLSLDDDVRKFVPQVPDYGTTITLRHLLNHTSGLRDYITLQ